MRKQNYKSLLLTASALFILTACNGGTTNNYTNNTIVDCQLPTFTPEIGSYLLTQWGNSVQAYSPANYSGGDVYVSAGYFAMTNYIPDAVLLPTVSSIQREGTQELYEYFTHFLALNPVMSIPNAESNVFEQLGCGYGGGNGYYDFVTNPGTLSESTVHARFTFVYKYESQPFTESFTVESGASVGQIKAQTNAPGWYILGQHSSILPVDN